MDKPEKNVIIVRGRGIEPAVNKMAYSLARNGYKVNLLVWDRQGTMNVGQSSGFSVTRCTFRAPYDSPLVMAYLPIWWIYELTYLLKNDCSVIHACDIDTIVPAVIAKMVKNVRLIYTIYDFYADCLPERTPGLFRKLIAFFDKNMIRFADTLILVDETRYAQINGAKIRKIEYICNTPLDHPEITQNPVHTSGLDTFVLFYAGAFLQDRGLVYVFEAINDIPHIQAIIAGFGPELEMVRAYAKKDPEKIQYLGLLSYDKVLDETLKADMLFAFYDPTIPNNRYASPNKLFEAMMCGKPIITNDKTSMAGIVRAENCGLIVPYGDISAIKNAIIMLKEDPELCNLLGANGRRAYEQKYSWTIMEKRLLAVYERLTD
jgi:glycosyltransferase involved in cell wall biosynthesis